MKYKLNSQLHKTLDSILNGLAFVARFSAKYPIQVITILLLVSSTAYLSLIQSAVQEWNTALSGFYIPTEYQNDILVENSIHFYRNSFKDPWMKISLEELNKVNQHNIYDHIYLYPIDFVRWSFESHNAEFDSFIKDLNDSSYIVYENKIYLVKHEFMLPNTVLKDNFNMIHWDPISSIESLMISLQKLRLFFAHMLQEQKLEFTDLIFILGSYFILFCIVINMFIDLNNMGSKIWLAFSLLLNFSCACCIAISVTKQLLNDYLSIFTLIQGLPFLIITVGFKDKINLSKYVLERVPLMNISRRITIDSIIFNAVKQEGIHLLRSYISILVVLIMAIFLLPSQIVIKDFSILSCLILLSDFFLIISFYSAILSLKMNIYSINRSIINREISEDEGISRISSSNNINISDKKLQKSLLISDGNAKMAKVTIISFIIVVNLYNVDFQWIFNILHSLYIQIFDNKSLPSFISNDPNRVNTLITIFPTQYLQYKNNIGFQRKKDNVTLYFLRIIGSIVTDQFMSKMIFIILLISIFTNIYLLKAARIHTKSTIKSLPKNTKTKELFIIPSNGTLNRKFSHISKTYSPLSPNSITSPTFSLTSTDDDEDDSLESSGTDTPLKSFDTSHACLGAVLQSNE